MNAETITDPSHNYSNYRRLLAETKPPLIPFQALYLKELTFIEENPDCLSETGWINFEKMALLGKVMTTIARQQTAFYKFNEVDVIMQYVRRPPIVLNDKELLIGSRQCEPSQESPTSAATVAGLRNRKSTSAALLASSVSASNIQQSGEGPRRRTTTRNLSVRLSRGFTNIRQSFSPAASRRENGGDPTAMILATSAFITNTPHSSVRPPSWSPWT